MIRNFYKYRNHLWSLSKFVGAFKVGLACMISFMVQHFFHFSGELIVITSLLVMSGGNHLGGTLKKSYLRFLGSLSGGLIAALCLIFLGHSKIVIALVLFLVISVFIYLEKLYEKIKPAGVLGALTVIIILTSVDPGIHETIMRLLEVLLGICIAVVVSFILPLHSITSLNHLLQISMRNFKLLYQINLCHISPDQLAIKDPYYFEEQLLHALGQQRRLLRQSKMELRQYRVDPILFDQIIRSQRGIFRSILFLNRISTFHNEINLKISSLAEVAEFHQCMIEILELLSKNNLISENLLMRLQIKVVSLEKAILKFDQENANNKNQTIYLHSFVGACQYLHHELHTLIKLTSLFYKQNQVS